MIAQFIFSLMHLAKQRIQFLPLEQAIRVHRMPTSHDLSSVLPVMKRVRRYAQILCCLGDTKVISELCHLAISPTLPNLVCAGNQPAPAFFGDVSNSIQVVFSHGWQDTNPSHKTWPQIPKPRTARRSGRRYGSCCASVSDQSQTRQLMAAVRKNDRISSRLNQSAKGAKHSRCHHLTCIPLNSIMNLPRFL